MNVIHEKIFNQVGYLICDLVWKFKLGNTFNYGNLINLQLNEGEENASEVIYD